MMKGVDPDYKDFSREEGSLEKRVLKDGKKCGFEWFTPQPEDLQRRIAAREHGDSFVTDLQGRVIVRSKPMPTTCADGHIFQKHPMHLKFDLGSLSGLHANETKQTKTRAGETLEWRVQEFSTTINSEGAIEHKGLYGVQSVTFTFQTLLKCALVLKKWYLMDYKDELERPLNALEEQTDKSIQFAMELFPGLDSFEEIEPCANYVRSNIVD